MKEKITLEPLFLTGYDSVVIRTTLDVRRNVEARPVVVIVTSKRSRMRVMTGEYATMEQYNGLLAKTTTRTSRLSQMKARIEQIHFDVVKQVRTLVGTGDFSLPLLGERLGKATRRKGTPLYILAQEFVGTKSATKTRKVYLTALASFFSEYGARYVYTEKDGKQVKKPTFVWSESSKLLLPDDITESVIAGWQKNLKARGVSDTTIGSYSRHLKAFLMSLNETGLLRDMPKIAVPAGRRRIENFLSVGQILKLMEYDGPHSDARDFWLMLYFCNGCNAIDFISLKWDEDYFQNEELSFVRNKTKGRSPSLVYIPVIEPLKELLDRFATKPKIGRELFPMLTGGAKTEAELSVRADYLNSFIRNGMVHVCREVGVPVASPAWARNSYITALTWHEVSDAFIDNMTGHVNGNAVLRGYQGRISPAKRRKINSLLLTPPDE